MQKGQTMKMIPRRVTLFVLVIIPAIVWPLVAIVGIVRAGGLSLEEFRDSFAGAVLLTVVVVVFLRAVGSPLTPEMETPQESLVGTMFAMVVPGVLSIPALVHIVSSGHLFWVACAITGLQVGLVIIFPILYGLNLTLSKVRQLVVK